MQGNCGSTHQYIVVCWRGCSPPVSALRDTHGLYGGGSAPEDATPAPPTVPGYLAHAKSPLPRTLQKGYACGPMMVLWGGCFLISEVPLYSADSPLEGRWA